MRIASLVLGIIGSALAIIFALSFILLGVFSNNAFEAVNEMDDTFDNVLIQFEDEDVQIETNIDFDTMSNIFTGALKPFLLISGILSIIGGVLGAVGAILIKKYNIAAGILFIVAAVLSFFTLIGIFASILFIVGGILSFIPEKQASAVAPANPQ
ncbi:MAG: DUF4064 domain-containing protein [Eubacteriales bacterium]|nr:DUF4064 domain-containing protein [Eubacteriales bacterium]